MATIGNGVSLRGIFHEDFSIPFNLAAGIVAADVGKAVTLDATAPATMKLCGNADIPMGQLQSVEDRTIEGVLVGAVMVKGFVQFVVSSGATLTVGTSVTGGAVADGEVIVAVVANTTAIVVEASAGLATVWLK